LEKLPLSSQFIFSNIATTAKQLKTNFTSIMKLVSIIFVASSVASTLAAERGLQVLGAKWNITDPTFAYAGLGFDLDYDVSDFVDNSNVATTLYTSPGCQLEGTVVPDGFLTSARPALTGVAHNPNGNGDGVREQNLHLTVVPATIASSGIYAEDTAVGAVAATIAFCVRFSLMTPEGGGDPIEVNFLETLVTLFVDLSDGFDIGDVNVAPKNKITNTANQVYLLEGYQCAVGSTVALSVDDAALTRNQGSVIRVCVTPDAEAVLDGIKMRSLDDFTFSRGLISQPAIIGYNQEASNGLTSLTCVNGADVCVFETILFAAFYTTTGTVLGTGTGSMQFGARRLRALQDRSESAAASEFDLDFEVDQGRGKNTGSGAATSGLMAATALVMAGAFALI
jgi:hypothetical protein